MVSFRRWIASAAIAPLAAGIVACGRAVPVGASAPAPASASASPAAPAASASASVSVPVAVNTGPFQGSGIEAQEAARVPADWRYPLHPKPTVAAHGMVVTDAALATQVGVDVLRAGGNAVDAAVATAFTLAVVYPEAGNLGGGGFMVAHLADGRAAALDFREMAPAAASRDMYLDAQGNLTDRSLNGWLASGVPGSVMGLWEAHKRFGSRPWATLVEPAIRLAEGGFVVDRHLHAVLAGDQPRIQKYEGTAALFFPGGQPLAEGTRFRNPVLAATLRRIAQRGAAGFYEGETAQAIEREMKANGGNITAQDLKNYVARWREPVEFTYRGRRVISMPPSSSGGLTLALIGNILQGYDLHALGWHSPQALHYLDEAERRAFADRNALLGDPDFVKVPAAQFLSPEYAAQLRAGIDRHKATPSAQVRAGLAAAGEGNHTTHFGVVDAHGNAVAITTTLNDLFGSGVTIAGAGLVMNDEMDDFAAKPGSPNMFGLVQGEVNAIAPGKRPLSAMTPTIVLDGDGSPLIVTGARGGPRIISAVYQVISNILDYGMDVGSAVNAPRVHMQHLPDTLFYEKNGFTPALLDSLRAMGQAVAPGGVANAPTIVRRGKLWVGIADPRSGGVAAGY